MRIGQEELKSVLQSFRWIDDIPEDQNKRDEICVVARREVPSYDMEKTLFNS